MPFRSQPAQFQREFFGHSYKFGNLFDFLFISARNRLNFDPSSVLISRGSFLYNSTKFQNLSKKVSKTAVFVLIDERTFSPVGKNQKNIFVRKNTIESLHAALTRNDLSRRKRAFAAAMRRNHTVSIEVWNYLWDGYRSWRKLL